MDIIQFIGFLISLGAILFIMGRHFWEMMYSQKHPEEYAAMQKQKEKQLREFLESLGEEEREEEEEEQEEELFQPAPVQQAPKPSPAATQMLAALRSADLARQPKPPEKIRPVLPHPTTRRFELPTPVVPVTRVTGKRAPSRAQQLVRNLKSPQDMVILSLIMESPRKEPGRPFQLTDREG